MSTATAITNLGDSVYLEDFFLSGETSNIAGTSFARRYLNAGGRAHVSHVVGDVADLIPMGNRVLVVAQTAWSLPGVIFLTMNINSTTLEYPAAESLSIGDTILCRTSMMREEHRTTLGSLTTEIYARSAYDDRLTALLATIDNSALFALAVENPTCREFIMRFARESPVVHSNTGHFTPLPTEIVYHTIGYMDMKTRLKFLATCKEHQSLITALLYYDLRVLISHYHLDFREVRFMLVATATLMSGYALQHLFGRPWFKSDCLDFFALPAWKADIIRFLTQNGRYNTPVTCIPGEHYTTWVLRTRGRRIRVLECHVYPLAAILGGDHSHRMAYCDGTDVLHAYAELTLEARTLTTSGAMIIQDTLEEHVEIWRLLTKAVRHGYTWIFEYEAGHECGTVASCPASARHSRDAGWLRLRLGDTGYGRACRQPIVRWSLNGAGCSTGRLEGEPTYSIPRADGRPGMARDSDRVSERKGCADDVSHIFVVTPLLIDTTLKPIDSCYVHFLDASPGALYKFRGLASTLNWSRSSATTSTVAAPAVGFEGDGDGSAMTFIVFGVVGTQFANNKVVLTQPRWHGEGASGSLLSVRFAEQVLVLVRAVESRGLLTHFDNEEILLTTTSNHKYAAGTVVFARVELSVTNTEDITREEPGLHASCFTPSSLRAFLGFLEEASFPLTTYSEDWIWAPTTNGLLAKYLKPSGRSSAIRFSIFGIVAESERPGIVTLCRPEWDDDGSVGRELSVHYDTQLVTLSRILEDNRWEPTFRNNEIVLEHDTPADVGSVYFATATLRIKEEVEDIEHEAYVLTKWPWGAEFEGSIA
ncbi:hypothetical protein B0H16DRAFT_1468763 [Mycena metata]|uniref:F-box domain-containing protein n=1 Tax=Mycena metata TaxID=1033252 RepID=A0AAD7HZP3_9AGAR|nr:hypothetical protein B0H16DRAFT_1468763 [Mycena metata]